MKRIVVIGSANMDTTNYLNSNTFPDRLTSESCNDIYETTRVLGGKGANQAVSAALQSQGTDVGVSFIGCVGKDESGLKIVQSLKEKGIDYSAVKVLNTETDGRVIFVNKNGENQMFGYGNCIKQLSPEVVFNKRTEPILRDADVVVIQMKMPDDTIEEVIDYCDEHMLTLMIDPTPVEKSGLLAKKGLIDKATYLTPNEEEAYALAKYEEGMSLEDIKADLKNASREEILAVIEGLVRRHPNVIATLGDKGIMYYNPDKGLVHRNPYPTECIDSTGAGDTFNGTFAAAISRGEDLETAIDYALMNCANKVKEKGAQNGMQTYAETQRDLEAYNKKHNPNGKDTSDDDGSPEL